MTETVLNTEKRVTLVGISGKIGSGKNTLATLIIAYAKAHGLEYTEHAFAYKVKLLCAAFANTSMEVQLSSEGKQKFNETFGMTYGEMQQKMGTEAIRHAFGADCWIKALFSGYVPGESRWIVTDVRFKNEAAHIRRAGGLLIRLEGDPAGVRARSTRDPRHPSETDLDDWTDWDLVVDNSGLAPEADWTGADIAGDGRPVPAADYNSLLNLESAAETIVEHLT